MLVDLRRLNPVGVRLLLGPKVFWFGGLGRDVFSRRESRLYFSFMNSAMYDEWLVT